MNELPKTKSPWQQPGGTLAKVTLVALIGAAGYAFYKYLPFLIDLTKNTLTLAVLVGVLALIVFLVMNDKSRNFFKNLYFVIMRKLTGLIVEIDPIAIAKGKVKDMKSRLIKIDEGISKIRGLHIKNGQTLANKQNELQEKLQRLEISKKRGSQDECNILQHSINQLNQFVKENTIYYEKSKKLIEILTKVRQSSEMKVRGFEEEIKLKEEKYELYKANNKTIKNVKSLIDPETDESYEMAIEKIDTDIATWIGEMDSFLESGIIDEISLDNAVASAKADKILEKYENGGFAGILEDNKVNLMKDAEFVKLEESSNKLQNKYF